MDDEIRPADRDDSAAITAIWNQGIEERRSTFETRPRALDEIASSMDRVPYLVAERQGGDVTGWARLTRWSTRECYSGIGEASVYVERTARGRGVGRALIEALVAEAEGSDHWKLLGVVFPENEASVAPCRESGFREVGGLE